MAEQLKTAERRPDFVTRKTARFNVRSCGHDHSSRDSETFPHAPRFSERRVQL